MKIAKLLIISIIVLVSISDSLACTCVNTSNISDEQHSKYLKKVKAIFYGEVISLGEKRQVTYKVKNRAGNSYDEITDVFQPITFRVLRAWKGVESPEITVEADAGSSCAFVPPIGSKLTIYAYENRAAKIEYSVNYCSVGVFDDKRMKGEYGEGRFLQPEETKEISISFWSRLWNHLVSYFS